MRTNRKKLAGASVALAVCGGILMGTATSASAATPSFEPDPDAVGTVTLYDGSGNVETSGSINGPMAAYYAGSGGATVGSPSPDNHFANATFYQPSNNPDPSQWSNDTIGSTQFQAVTPSPSASYPGVLHNSPNAIYQGAAGDLSVGDFINDFPLTQRDPGVFELRIDTGDTGKYYRTDFMVSGNTWTQVFPAPVVTTTVSAISPTPGTPAPHASSVTLAATVTASDSSHPGGTVELFDDSTATPTDLGAASYDSTTGAVTKTLSPADGTHKYKYVFTPSATGVTGSSSAELSYTVNAPAPATATTTVVSGATSGTTGSPITYTATVTANSGSSVPTGKVQFSIDGSASGPAVTLDAAGKATFQYTPADTSAHTIKAAFTPTSQANFVASSDATGVTVTASAPANAPDAQTIDVNVPAGTLVISTPYTPANPLHLGNLVLNSTGTSLDTVPVAFGDPAAHPTTDPGTGSTANGVTITDTRAGSTGWNASAVTSNFTNTSTSVIDGNDLAFTNVTPKYLDNNNLKDAPGHRVTTNDISAFATAKIFATTTAGPGTVNITGKLALSNVPTSTLPGLYTATVTFTIV